MAGASVLLERRYIMAKRLFVGSLSYDVTQGQLEELFATVGTVTSVNLITDRDTGNSKGFAFIDMASDAEAEKAIKELNGKEISGRAIIVNEARPREERPGGFNRGGGSFSERRPRRRP